MRKVVDRQQMNAVMSERLVGSPGWAGRMLGVSRQRVSQLYGKPEHLGGLFAWMVPAPRTDLFKRQLHYVYVDFGWRDGPANAHAWESEDLDEVLAECERRYAAMWAERVKRGVA